jgi:hypothetical protein
MFANIWLEIVASDISKKGGYAEDVAATELKGEPASDWNRLALPIGPCEFNFTNAVSIAFGDSTNKYCKKYLMWAVELANRALDDPRFSVASENSSKGWMNSPMFPGNLGEVRAVKVLANAMLTANGLDVVELMISADEIAQSALLYKGNHWDEIIQARYLYAVRLMIIAGDWLEASRLLKVKRKFSQLPQLFEILNAIVESGLRRGVEDEDNEDIARFDAYFETIRSPKALKKARVDSGGNRHLYIFEMALIRQRLLRIGPIFPDWDEVWKSINSPTL